MEGGREREREKAVYDRYYMYILLLSVIVRCTTCVYADINFTYMCMYSACTVSVNVVIGAFTRFTVEVVVPLLWVYHLSSAFLILNSHTRGWPAWLRNLQGQQFH